MSTMQGDATGDNPPSQPPPERPRRLQFGLSTMLLITTVTAILCSLVFSVPFYIALPLMLFMTVAVPPAVWTMVIIYGRGYQRTFGIGAMFPAGARMLLGVMFYWELPFSRGWPNGGGDEEITVRLVVCGLWLSSLLVGVICAGVRWIVEKRRSALEVRHPGRVIFQGSSAFSSWSSGRMFFSRQSSRTVLPLAIDSFASLAACS